MDSEKSEPIPPMMVPPIGSVPYEEAQKIIERHGIELMHIPGVTGVGLGADGIRVRTSKPELLPREIEGVPVKAAPPNRPRELLSHTSTFRVRPIRGAVRIADPAGRQPDGTIFA